MPSHTNPPCALTIAGSDSGGGAGIQADINTFAAHGVFGTTAITAITSQNTIGVHGIFCIPVDVIQQQIQVVLSDFDIKAIKTGMLHNTNVINAVADLFADTNIKLVIDPVMVSTSGKNLLEPEAVSSMIDTLMPLAYCITPNVPEALEILKHIKSPISIISNENEMEKAALLIANHVKCPFVLIKGGHMDITRENNKVAVDVLYDRLNKKCHKFEGTYLDSKNTHGTGCSLSAAIVANLAKGKDMVTAVKDAKDYLCKAIESGFKLGKGEYGTPNHINFQ
jgi:hydroxymethylpyrimidine kinase/phosphomethylpyrimidine kinase